MKLVKHLVLNLINLIILVKILVINLMNLVKHLVINLINLYKFYRNQVFFPVKDLLSSPLLAEATAAQRLDRRAVLEKVEPRKMTQTAAGLTSRSG